MSGRGLFTKKSKFLVVDDYKTIRFFLRQSLGELGYFDVDEATNGQIALEMIKESLKKDNPYSIVFLDWNMPAMTGMELLQVVRRFPKMKEIPFVMVSAESETKAIIEAAKMGVVDYIVKPFPPSILREKILKIEEKILNMTTSEEAG
jgi:two-component system chemotaxis response regulator CheY